MNRLMAMARWLPVTPFVFLFIKEACARAVIETSHNAHKAHSMEGLSVGIQALLYTAVASVVVLMIGLLLYCITCIQGTKKRQRAPRRYNKPATIVIKPARVKTHQQTRGMRPMEPVHPVNQNEYETHSLTMYIPPED